MLATREDVDALLKEYPKWEKRIALLEFERENPARASDLGTISSWALGHPIDGPGASGHISNKTMQIALNFQEATERINYSTVMEIDKELLALRDRVKKMDFYISQLDPKQAAVLKGHYFEGKTWEQLQKELHISSRTLSSRRDAGLDALIAMEKYLEEVTKQSVHF